MPDSVGSCSAARGDRRVPALGVRRSLPPRSSRSSRSADRRRSSCPRFDCHMSAAWLAVRRPAVHLGHALGRRLRPGRLRPAAACRSWPTTRRCSGASSARSIRTRATTRSRRRRRVRSGKTEIVGVLHPRLAAPRRSAEAARRSPRTRSAPRVMRRFGGDATIVDVRGDARKVIARAYVDYTWIGDLDVTVRQRLNPRVVACIGRGYGQTDQVDRIDRGPRPSGRRAGRRRRPARRARAARWSCSAACERVIDADPLDRQPGSWAFAGFRLREPN